uniref:Uncharacterized protein n=1 Tax=Arundo donax TaxID=35708 RepID=A0A0A9A6Y7_ARUDO
MFIFCGFLVRFLLLGTLIRFRS